MVVGALVGVWEIWVVGRGEMVVVVLLVVLEGVEVAGVLQECWAVHLVVEVGWVGQLAGVGAGG